jgi:hypothetical protein
VCEVDLLDMCVRGRTKRITEAAPVTPGMQLERTRGIRCIRWFGDPPEALCLQPVHFVCFCAMAVLTTSKSFGLGGRELA